MSTVWDLLNPFSWQQVETTREKVDVQTGMLGTRVWGASSTHMQSLEQDYPGMG